MICSVRCTKRAKVQNGKIVGRPALIRYTPCPLCIVDNCPEFTRSIKKVKDELLDDLPKYRLTFARPEQIVSLLPEHLRPKPLRTLVREELHRDCEDTKCKTHGDGCVVVNRLRGILFSQELADGIKRILKHQRYSATLPDDVQATIDGFQSTININCMKVLTTQLVYNETGQAIPESSNHPKSTIQCRLDKMQEGQNETKAKS